MISRCRPDSSTKRTGTRANQAHLLDSIARVAAVIALLLAIGFDRDRQASAASSVSVTAWTCPPELPLGTIDRAALASTCVDHADGVTFALNAGGLTRRRVTTGGQPAIWPAAAGNFVLTIDEPTGEPAVVYCDQAGRSTLFNAPEGVIQGTLGESENLSCEWYRITGSEAAPAVTPTASTQTGQGTTLAEFSERIDIGGRFLFVSCRGAGAPTIVLEAGGPDGTSSRWDSLLPLLPTSYRVCTYDRAGLGQSDPAPAGSRTIQDSVNDLRALVSTGRLGCPCVFAGESWGANIVRLYAGQYPADASGIVLVDSVPPGFVEAFLSLVPSDTPGFSVLMGADNDERMDQLRSFRESDAASIPPSMPAVVITHGLLLGFPISFPVEQLESVWRQGQERLAADLHADFVVAERSSNSIVRDQPDVIVAAMQTVVSAVTDPASVPGSIVIRRLDGAGKPVTGACFQIYVDAGNGVHGEYRGGACDPDFDGEDNGLITLSPAAPGNYVIQEVKPPDGEPALPDQAIAAQGLASYATFQSAPATQVTVTT